MYVLVVVVLVHPFSDMMGGGTGIEYFRTSIIWIIF
jgi:hypothetical protein